MGNRYSHNGKKLHGAYGSKAFYRRPRSPDCRLKHIRSKEFCQQYGISRWVAYRACQVKKLISGIRKGGVWHYAIIPECEVGFETYLLKTRNMRKPRLKNESKAEYNLGF